MRIGIQTWGSEGDIRPFVALGHALTRRGHHVELLYTEIGSRRYEAVAEALGFSARAVASPVVADERELYEIGLKAINTRNELEQGLWISRRLLEPVIPQVYEAGLELARRNDVVVQHFILHGARAAADKIGTPVVTVALAHMLVESRYIHPSGLPNLGEWGNVLEWKIARVALNRTLLKDVNRWRAHVGLPAFAELLGDGWASHRLHLIASSPALIDRPSDWPAWNQLCGFLHLPSHEHETLAPEVEAFLASGPAPVFMGFGSLMPLGTHHLTDTVAVLEAAARQAGRRAIIQAEIDRPATADVLFVRRTPHARVFPRCAAIVHHAGAGTTHTTLKSGVPSVPVPHVSDQFSWSSELHRLGVAPKPLRRTKLTAAALASRIRESAGNVSMMAAARRIQARMATDDGPVTAAMMIERAMI
ncbi:MAG TPA: glycosyltransferase [Vicinamibacterales bacterium]|nr:glycosyltransferase [Vicinamibacterales bacterium]